MTLHGRDYTTLVLVLGGDPLILHVRVCTYHTPYECREQVIEFSVLSVTCGSKLYSVKGSVRHPLIVPAVRYEVFSTYRRH